MRQTQSTQSQVGSGVGNRAKNIFDGFNHLVHHEISEGMLMGFASM